MKCNASWVLVFMVIHGKVLINHSKIFSRSYIFHQPKHQLANSLKKKVFTQVNAKKIQSNEFQLVIDDETKCIFQIDYAMAYQ